MRAVKSGVTRVTRNPRVQFGEPTVRGSRTTVASIVVAAQAGDGVEGIREAFPHLTPDDVADALAFYLQNRSEMDDLIEQAIAD